MGFGIFMPLGLGPFTFLPSSLSGVPFVHIIMLIPSTCVCSVVDCGVFDLMRVCKLVG